MAYLEESCRIISDDQNYLVDLKKDAFGNLKITLTDPDGVTTLEIPSEILPTFIHATNRLFN